MDGILYSGKPIEKMTWIELQREIRVQTFYASRMERFVRPMEYHNYKKKCAIEEKYQIAEKEKQFERGEITEEELKKAKKYYKIEITKWLKKCENARYLRIHQYTARAVIEACLERQKFVVKPKTRKRVPKPKYYKFVKLHYQSKREEYVRVRRERLAYIRWQQSIEVRSLGGLFDREKFMNVARSKGFLSDISIYCRTADALDCLQVQAKHLLKTGKLTWGQVLTLGAVYEMTPKEFADTFMSGYFKEVTDGVYKATLDSVPDDLVDKSVLEWQIYDNISGTKAEAEDTNRTAGVPLQGE